jgi:hypothetical protein
MASVRTAVSVSFVLGLLVAIGCGSSGDDSNFGDGSGSGSDGTSGSSGFGSSGNGTSGGTSGAPCVGLQCKQVACPGGGTTSLSGKVYDPSGTVPLYNAVVFVPNADLDAFAPGVTCDKCGTTPSGKPVTTALTDATGSFTLKNVPVGVDVPLVVQIGRWRRKITLPAASVTKCGDAKVDAANTRLPRNKAEGNIPKIAITTGGADSLECFLRKMGLDQAEFTNPSGAGSIHLYQGIQKDKGGTDGSIIDANTPAATDLWEGPDASKLKAYDITILSCEGSENNTTKSTQARSNLKDYLDAGGRVFASHFHYTWFKNGSMPLPTTATWTGARTAGNANVSVDTSFAKGQAFSDWLDTVSATTSPKSATVAMTALKADVTTVPGSGGAPDTSRRWLYTKNTTEESKFYSFNAPIGNAPDKQCGRGVFTDIHVSSGDTPGGTFPANCTTTGYTAQEKALLFLLMDLASCIQDDTKAPTAPPPDVPTVK